MAVGGLCRCCPVLLHNDSDMVIQLNNTERAMLCDTEGFPNTAMHYANFARTCFYYRRFVADFVV